MNLLKRFDRDFVEKIFLVTSFFLIYLTLPWFIGFNISFFLIFTISTIITIYIWKKEDMLKEFNFGLKYAIYYVILLIVSYLLIPSNHKILKVLYNNGIREELFFRFFMVGIFLKNIKEDTTRNKVILNSVLIYTNIIFTFAHDVDILRHIYLLLVGIIFSSIFLCCGILSSIFFHTIHNIYMPEDHPLIAIFCILPLIYSSLKINTRIISKYLNNLKLFFEIFFSATIASLIGFYTTEEVYSLAYMIALFVSIFITLIVVTSFFIKDQLFDFFWYKEINGYLKNPIIGIIFDEKTEKHFTRLKIDEWVNYFKEKNLIVEKISINDLDLKYSAIINPYGETYPEEDLFHLKTFDKIRRYINKGGIFVNIAGIPFFYGCDIKTGKNVPLANEIYTYVQIRKNPFELIPLPKYPPEYSIIDTLVHQHFKVITTTGGWEKNPSYQNDRDKYFVGNIWNIGNTEQIFQFRAVRVPTRKFIPFLRAVSSFGEVFPIAGIPYGRGCLVACGFTFNIEESHKLFNETIHRTGFEKICWTIINLINYRKNGKIPLNTENW
ncbi:MAG: CPBP family intramembrane glutamic endopeptidase [Candidatus Odinarchaeia archaeon]